MLTAAVAAGDAKSTSSLRACLEQTGLVDSVAEWTPSAERHPGPGETVPEIVLLDLAGGTETVLEFAAHLRRVKPSVCIIACSPLRAPDPQLLMQAMRSGVREFLAHPVDASALESAVRRFIDEHRPDEGAADRKLLVVMGAKGGVGTTTVAVNLGAQLARATKKRVVLLDFARPLGHVSLLLDLQTRFSVCDAVGNLERLDSHFFKALLTHHEKSGLEVLAGTADPDDWSSISIPALTRVVNVAQSGCDYLLVDLGSSYTAAWKPLLRLAKMVLLVAEADVPALWTLERHLTKIGSWGISGEQSRIVINRWHRADEEALKAFERRTKSEIFARLPNDFRQVSEAVNLGTPLSRNHNNPLVSNFQQLAARVAGVTSSRHAEVPARKGAILGLFNTSKK